MTGRMQGRLECLMYRIPYGLSRRGAAMARKHGKDRGIVEKPTGSGIWWCRLYREGKEHWYRCQNRSQAKTLYGKLKAQIREDAYFPKAEKHEPITLSLAPSTKTSDAVQVTVKQRGEVLCTATITRQLGATARALPSSAHAPHDPVKMMTPEARLIHKARPENVLVSELCEEGDGERLIARTRPLPADHALAQGDPRQLSMLYLLEVGRQTFMLNAHQRFRVPLGLPMNLLRLRFSLSAPIPRHLPLTLVPVSAPQRWNGLLVTGTCALEVRVSDRTIGRGEFQAQAIEKDLYTVQRTTRNQKA